MKCLVGVWLNDGVNYSIPIAFVFPFVFKLHCDRKCLFIKAASTKISPLMDSVNKVVKEENSTTDELQSVTFHRLSGKEKSVIYGTHQQHLFSRQPTCRTVPDELPVSSEADVSESITATARLAFGDVGGVSLAKARRPNRAKLDSLSERHHPVARMRKPLNC